MPQTFTQASIGALSRFPYIKSYRSFLFQQLENVISHKDSLFLRHESMQVGGLWRGPVNQVTDPPTLNIYTSYIVTICQGHSVRIKSFLRLYT